MSKNDDFPSRSSVDESRVHQAVPGRMTTTGATAGKAMSGGDAPIQSAVGQGMSGQATSGRKDRHRVAAAGTTSARPAWSRTTSRRNVPAVHGLVLGGGKSSRMGSDKAAIDYHGVPQVRYAVELLESVVDKVFVSVRPEQADDPVFQGLNLIPDRFIGFGPAGGILSALHAVPDAAWLVLGCDLPFVDRATLQDLVSARNPRRFATTYIAPESGLPEPMCTIFEPRFRARFHSLFAEDITCPRKALIRSRCRRIELSNPHALDNVNSPEQRDEALARLHGKDARPSTAGAPQYQTMSGSSD